MKRWLTILALVGSMVGLSGPSQADTLAWFAGFWLSRYANMAQVSGLEPAGEVTVVRTSC